MATTIDAGGLSDRFEEMLARSAAGEEVFITKGNEGRAKLVFVQARKKGPMILGLRAGLVEMAPDFDDPLLERNRSRGGKHKVVYSQNVPSLVFQGCCRR